LIFPVVLDRSAVIESTSPTSGSTIRVIATATAVTAVEPAAAVVSLVNPADLTSIRSSFCNQVHYFASPEDAQPWLAQHPGGELLPVGEASRLAVDLTARMLDRLTAATPRIRDVDAVRHANLPRASSHPAATPQA
jgi:alkylmercury lyase